MTVVSPSVSTEESRRTSALRFAMRWVPNASASVTVGSSPSGTFATVTPMANTKRSSRPMPRNPATTKKSEPRPKRDDSNQARDAAELQLERARLLLRMLRQLRDPAELRGHTRRDDDRLGSPSRDMRSRVDESVGRDRTGLARERRVVDPKLMTEHDLGVRADAITGGQDHEVAGDKLLGRDLGPSPSRRTRAVRGRTRRSASLARSALLS